MASRLREKRLFEFIATRGKEQWVWSVNDCTITAANWIKQETGKDPAKRFRGTYSTAEECQAVMNREGGFMPLVGFQLDRCGFERTQAPGLGDVGVVSCRLELRDRLPVVGPIIAICTGFSPMGKAEWIAWRLRGFVIEAMPLVTAWKIG